MKKAPKKRSGPSGLNLQPRRTFRATAAEFAAMDAVAKTWGLTWTQWARTVLVSPERAAELRIEKP